MDKTIAMSLCLLCGIISPGAETPLKASWIWLKGADVHSYNQAVVARKEFRLAKPGPAALRITADSFYRLFINGNWVNDGPARSLPEHFQDDVIDATPFLVDGAKEIHIVARYFGVGDFHRVPQQAGLLAQLDVQLTSGLVDGASLRLAKTKPLVKPAEI
jgi:alpha-L-rhamnosidase